jgi:RNA polymerase sigma factor (sigma-70 family)
VPEVHRAVRIRSMDDSGQLSDAHPPGAEHFATTQWSLVLAAGDRRCADADRALDRLCRAYWPPLYAYVRRRVGDVHEAQDLTQAFFERLLEKRYLEQADPQRGRFRAFLITAFKHFLANEWDKAKSQKRGAGWSRLAFDFASHEPLHVKLSEERSAERLYERQWAIALLNRVMDHLQREMERKGQGRDFQCLKEFIGGAGLSTYAAPAKELGITESAARMAASRLRTRYRELLRDEISQTICAAEDIDDEVRQLFRAIAD